MCLCKCVAFISISRQVPENEAFLEGISVVYLGDYSKITTQAVWFTDSKYLLLTVVRLDHPS